MLLGIFVVDTIAMIFGMPSALFPAFADRLGGGPTVLGLMYSSLFAGALVASLDLRPGWARPTPGARRLRGAWCAAIALVGFAQSVMALILLAVAGAADFVSAVCGRSSC